MYGVGHNEELVGKALAIAAIVVPTKFGNVRGSNGGSFERQAGLCTLSL